MTRLFDIVRRLKARGVGIVYISHRLDEIFEIADRVTVLRDGAYVGARQVAETNTAELVQMMVGRRIENLFPKAVVPIGAPVLEARDIVRRPMTKRRQPHRARGRDRRPRRPRRLRAQRIRPDRLRRHAGRIGRNPAHGRAGQDRLAGGGARQGHRLCARGPRRAGARPADERSAQFLARRAWLARRA